MSDPAKARPPRLTFIRTECPSCGYLARVTRKWLDAIGAPICPRCHRPLRADPYPPVRAPGAPRGPRRC